MSNHSRPRSAHPDQLSFDETILGVAETVASSRWPLPKDQTVFVGPSSISLTGQRPAILVTEIAQVAPTGERVYPHIYDASAGPSAIAMALIRQALDDARAAADAYNNSDLGEVSTRLGLIAASMARAHLHTDFNECLGAVVSYIRRATLQVDVSQITLEQIVVLNKALNAILSEPMLNVNAAADLTDEIERAGLHGESRDVAALIAALLEERVSAEVQPEPEQTHRQTKA